MRLIKHDISELKFIIIRFLSHLDQSVYKIIYLFKIYSSFFWIKNLFILHLKKTLLKWVKQVVFGLNQYDLFIKWVMRVGSGQFDMAYLSNESCHVTRLFNFFVLRLRNLTPLLKWIVSGLTLKTKNDFKWRGSSVTIHLFTCFPFLDKNSICFQRSKNFDKKKNYKTKNFNINQWIRIASTNPFKFA